MDQLDACLTQVLPLIDVDSIIQDAVALSQIELATDFDSFAKSAHFLHQRFAAAGIPSTVLSFPADGVTKFQCWTAPIGFRTTRAECHIIEPHQSARTLGLRPFEPNTAIVGTGHTGPQGLIAPVIHITSESELETLELDGKIAYCSDLHPMSIRQAVAQKGGKAILSSYARHRDLNAAFVQWINTWDSAVDGWLPTAAAARENLVGVSISPEQGAYLEACLARGPVVLSIIVEGEYFPSTWLGVTASLPGREPGAVLLTGHLFEAGLTDNAAGAALGLWVTKIVADLSKRSELPPLRRGLRNFHSQECYGALALAHSYPAWLAGTVAHLNIDMVGAAGLPVGLLPGLLVSSGPAGFLLRLIAERVERRIPGCCYRSEAQFDINCTLLADPLLGGIPTAQIEQLSSVWHSSRDRAGTTTLDRDTIASVAAAAATWAAFLATAGDKEIDWLLAAYRADTCAALQDGRPSDTALFLALREEEMSVTAGLASPRAQPGLLQGIDTFMTEMRRSLGRETVISPQGDEEAIRMSKQRFPKALIGGPAVANCFTAEQLQRLGQPKWSALQLILKAWADGKRSIYDIARLAAYETGEPVSLPYALDFFETYAAQGLVRL